MSQGPKVMDIAKPGTLKNATAGGRPVIVTNRVIVQDPMVTPAESGDKPADAEPAVPKEKLVIKPLVDDNKDELDAANKEGLLNVDAEEPEEKGDDAEEAPKEPETKPEKPETTDVDEPDSEKAESEGSDAGKKSAKADADAKVQEELDGLTENKTYFLPITTAENRRNRLVAILGTLLIILLVLAWLDVALDAGFIDIPGVQPLTHFFNS